jgi:hypothetical protein
MNELLNCVTESDYSAVASPDWPSYSQAISMVELSSTIKTRIDSMLADYKEKQDRAKYFCAFAFYGAEYAIRPPFNTLRCCDRFTDNMSDIRQSMLDQQRPKDCSRVCWEVEDAGELSLRQIMNNTLDMLLDKDIAIICEESNDVSTDPLIYKIEPSNLCNSTCVTCSSNYSSAWAQLEKNNGEIPADHVRWIATEHGLSDKNVLYPINYKSAKMINFLGGETTLSKTNFHVLEYLVAAGNFDCLISFTTHGNFQFTVEQEQLLKQFKRLQFNFSIDGVGPVYEYLRYPLSWQYMNDNLQWCRDNQIEISVNLTVSNLNLYYLDQTIDWLESQKLNYRLNRVVNFKIKKHQYHYHGTSLSQRVKHIIKNHSKNQFVIATLDQPHSDQNDYWYEQFLLDIIKQDRWKGIKIQDYLGEFAQIIQDDLDRAQRNRFIPIQVL